MDNNELSRLLASIENELNWGPAKEWNNRDFERLNILILERTKVSLSSSTLKRIWGKVNYNNQPSLTTLDALSRFAGFESWREFCRQPAASDRSVPPFIPEAAFPAKRKKSYVFAFAILMAVLLVILFKVFNSRQNITSSRDHSAYSFTSKAITRDIPNSVVFNYDARAAGSRPVMIQQSWDKTRRNTVPADIHQFTSIYYRPGFYQAKLIVANEVVKEHPLLIPTKGWLGLLAKDPAPVYLGEEEFLHQDHLGISAEFLRQKLSQEQWEAPVAEFYNVGNFVPVPINSLSFTVDLKNTFSAGASKCAVINVQLITDNQPLNIPLSMPGCISNLYLSNGEDDISGRSNDLSSFGIALGKWTRVSCKTSNGKIDYLINDQLVYQTKQPKKKLKVLGIGITFQGGGMIKNVRLWRGPKLVFSSY